MNAKFLNISKLTVSIKSPVVLLDFSSFLKRNSIILVALFVFISLTFLFFPKFYSSTDEHEYLKNSVILVKQGSIAVKDIFSSCRSSFFSESGYLSAYPIGQSLFLLPFVLYGWFDFLMASGVFLHILNFLLLIVILKRLEIRKEFSMLYMFFPAFLWASRTLYPHLLVLSAFFAGTYFYLGKSKISWLISGFAFGFSYLVRQDSAIGIIAFGLPLLLNFFIDPKKNWKKLACFGSAAGLFIFILVPWFSAHYYDTILQTTNLSAFKIEILVDIPIYGLLLFTFYPLLIFSPIYSLAKGKSKEILVPIILLIIPYLAVAATMSIFDFKFSIETLLTARMRYLIPAIGLLLIPYSVMLQDLFEKLQNYSKLLKFRNLFVAMLLVFSASTAVASYKHAEFINNYRYSVFEAIHSNIPDDALVIGSSDDEMYFIRGFFSDNRYLSIDLNQCLAGNPENISINSFIAEKPYLIMLDYPYLKGRDAPRQSTVNKERQMMADFIEENKSNLLLVYNSEKHNLSIYRFK